MLTSSHSSSEKKIALSRYSASAAALGPAAAGAAAGGSAGPTSPGADCACAGATAATIVDSAVSPVSARFTRVIIADRSGVAQAEQAVEDDRDRGPDREVVPG